MSAESEEYIYTCTECNNPVGENDIICPNCGAGFDEIIYETQNIETNFNDKYILLNSEKTKMIEIFFISFLGMLGTILLGILFVGAFIGFYILLNTEFFINLFLREFIVFGLYGALFFGLLEYKSVRDQIYGIIFMVLLYIIILSGRNLSMGSVIVDSYFLGSLFLSIKLYHKYISKYPKIKFYLRGTVLSLFYALIKTLFFVFISIPEFPSIRSLDLAARYAAVVGLGIGLGMDFYLQNKLNLNKLLKIKTI